MITPDTLHTLLERTAREVHTHGALTWQRFADWEKPPVIPTDSTRGGGTTADGRSDDAIREAIGDAQASRYRTELAALTRRLHHDLHRLSTLIRIANPDTPRQEIGGGCRSCARDAARYEPVAIGRYRDACRWCGDWRAAHGTWPPLAVVRWRGEHPGKRVPLSIVEQASRGA